MGWKRCQEVGKFVSPIPGWMHKKMKISLILKQRPQKAYLIDGVESHSDKKFA